MAERWVLTPTNGKPLVLAHTPQRGGCRVIGVQTPPPARRVQWSQRSEGSLPTSKEYENRDVTLTLQLAPPVDEFRFQTFDFGSPAPEAEGDGDVPGYSGTVRRVSADGNPVLPMVSDLQSTVADCAASGGTLRRVFPSGASVTFDVMDAEGPDGPTWDIAYYAGKTTPLPLRFTCSPFARGSEALLGQATKAAGQRLLTVGGLQVPGDVPALTRLELSGATVAQTSLLYAIDQPDAATAALGVQTAASALLAVPGSGSTSQSGSVTVAPRLVPAAGTSTPDGQWRPVQYLRRFDGPPLALSGQYRVVLRVWRSGQDAPLALRLRWSGGAREAGMSENARWTSSAQGWQLADLGSVALTGSLDGIVERLTPNATDLIVDALLLLPIGDSFARAVASTQITSGVVTASDPGTGSGALTGSTARVGGTWIAGGSGSDFTRGLSEATKPAAGPRYAALSVGSADQEMSAILKSSAGGLSDSYNVGVAIGNAAGLANLLTPYGAGTSAAGAWAVFAVFIRGDMVGYFLGGSQDSGQRAQLKVQQTSYSTADDRWPVQTDKTFRISHNQGSVVVSMSGFEVASFASGLPAAPSDMQVAVIADTTQVSFRNFIATGAEAPDRLLHPGKTSTIATDGATKVTPAGYAAPFLPEGDRPVLPPAGRAARAARVVFGVSRDDFQSGADTVGNDTFTGKVYATPRYLQVPVDIAPAIGSADGGSPADSFATSIDGGAPAPSPTDDLNGGTP